VTWGLTILDSARIELRLSDFQSCALPTTVDYLHTRADIDADRLIFSGFSLGACIAPVLLVEEPRFCAAVLISGGYQPKAFLPEIEPLRYTPHVTLPILMINGTLDEVFPLKSSQLPMFRHLGSTDKQIKHFDCGHFPPVTETVKFGDEWLRARRDHDARATGRSN
jgi:pimeloyl-ACP methyl ester carboxylesterase